MDGHILNTRYGIDEENLSALSEDAKDYALFNGISMRVKDLSSDARVPLPFCLVPSPLPAKFFKATQELQPYINFILHKISYSKEYLKDFLDSTIEVDEFTRNIFKIFEATRDDQQLTLGLIRSDYLLDSNPGGKITGIKQVEHNVISSSFGGVGPKVRDLHGFVLDKLGRKGFDDKLPLNESVSELAKGIVSAWDAYDNKKAVVLFVVEDITYNICDQKALEYEIMDFENQLEIIRYSFKELRTHARLKSKTLLVNDQEVAVVYYRTGYVPEQYEPEDWEVRLLMERSKAIKCPSAGLHLAGTKKVQAYLTQPSVLEKFVNPDIAVRLREVFAAQYTLNMGSEGDKAVAMGIANPDKYVMKPEREGGGNNVYGADIKCLLEKIGQSEERKAYILMERISPPKYPNCIILRDKIPEIQEVVSELGIFGVFLGNKDSLYVNNTAGHLLRTKGAYSDETGVAAGFGALDSPYLE